MDDHQTQYIIVTPVRDEAAYIEKTISSVAAQTIRPSRWIIVDDGSTDGTSHILDVHAARHDWITVVHRNNRGFRCAGGGVMDAFDAGFSLVAVEAWEFLVKLDGDLSFAPDYFEQCFARFASERKLGIGGGLVSKIANGRLVADSAADPPFHVRGATKIYRRQCWDKIAPLVKAPGWDTIDEVKANLHGWTTRTFTELTLIQHKPTGAAAGRWGNALKNGRANYMTGYHPIFMLAKCVKRALRRPYFLESAALLSGYCSGYVRRIPRLADDDVVRYLRQQQLRRLLLRPSIYGQLHFGRHGHVRHMRKT